MLKRLKIDLVKGIMWLCFIVCQLRFAVLHSLVYYLVVPFLPSSPIQVNIQNTVRVGEDINKSVVTLTPDINEPVKLECERTDRDRNWYNNGSKVTPFGQLTTTDMTGVATLSISALNVNNAGNYTCKVTANGNTTEYTIVLGKHN